MTHDPDFVGAVQGADISHLPSPADRLRQLTPVLEEASVAIATMTGPQRVALAIQLIRDLDTPSDAAGLLRLARLAQSMGDELQQRQFVQEAG